MQEEATVEGTDEKMVVRIKINPVPDGGAGLDASQLVDALKKTAEDSNSKLSTGKLFSTLDKTQPWTTETNTRKADMTACQISATLWGYKDSPSEMGPANWSTSFPKCATANIQSPVKLPKTVPKTAKIVQTKLMFSYKKSRIKLENDGRNLNGTLTPGATMSVSGVTGSDATLQYMTFHSPSEHVFTDDTGHETRYALEIQFHHRQKKDSRVVVVAVLFQVNSENKVLTELLKTIPEDCKDFQVSAEFNLEDLFPVKRNFYMYDGSLTTPPCTDSTTWYVMRAHSNLALSQLEAFRKAMKLDVIAPPAQAAPLGTQLGQQKIQLIKKSKFPDYGFSKTLLGNARPVQEFGSRTLEASPVE